VSYNVNPLTVFGGSYPLWVADVNCVYTDGKDCKAQKDRYNVKKSSSGKNLTGRFDIEYGIGYAIGYYVSDIVGVSCYNIEVELFS
jgi:hypothetical protein